MLCDFIKIQIEATASTEITKPSCLPNDYLVISGLQLL